MNVLAFDFASGGISAAVFDSQLSVVRSAEAHWDLEATEDGAASLPANIVTGQFKSVITQLKLTPADCIDAICIDTFMHNCVLLDSADQPLTPLFTWMDQRGSDGVEFLQARVGDDFHERTGCRFHPMFPVFKLASMRLAADPALTAARRIVSVKSLVMHELTGVWLEDHGIASSSGLFNIRDRRWDPDILKVIGLNSSQFPAVASRNTVVAAVTPAAAGSFGLTPGIPVVNGTGDGFAANVGSGCEGPEKISVTLGTSAVVRQTLSQPVLVSKAGTFCYMADENAYLLGCAGNNGGNVLDWGRTILGGLAETNGTPDPPIFIPLLYGERSPDWNPNLTGSWHGLTARHTKADLERSIVEGVIFNLAHFLEIVQGASAVPAAELIVSGNGFLHPLAAPILASLARIPVSAPEQPGLMSLRGVAICALRALGSVVPKLSVRRITPLGDVKILQRYGEYRRFRGTLARKS